MAARGGFEIGFKTDRVKNVIGCEALRDRAIVRGFCVNRSQAASDFRRRFQIDIAIAEPLFPDWKVLGIQVLDRKSVV